MGFNARDADPRPRQTSMERTAQDKCQQEQSPRRHQNRRGKLPCRNPNLMGALDSSIGAHLVRWAGF